MEEKKIEDKDAAVYDYVMRPILLLVPPGSAQPVYEARVKEAEALRGRFRSCGEGLGYARSLRDVAVRDQITRSSSDLPAEIRKVLGAIPVGQLSAPEVLDVSHETREVRRLYGIDKKETADFGRNCLIARRLLERGVRFVQVWCGADNGFPRRNWDSHEDLARDHGDMGRGMDRPAAALIKDLKSRGLLDDTIVMWTTEFGRMPCSQGGKGRDHNPEGFTVWLAGGGVKPGFRYGSTDDYGWYAAENKVHVHDLHATILALLGLDHEKLTFRHAGRDFRLTDVAGTVVNELFA